MPDEIKAWIPGIPKGQPRARRGNVRGRLYDPGTADGWKTAVLAFLIGKLPHAPWTGPVFLSLRFHMPRPKSHYGTGKNAGRLKPSAPEYSEAKPDTDNLEKAVMDALEGRLFKNDSQVAVQPTFKPYANGPTGLELEARKL